MSSKLGLRDPDRTAVERWAWAALVANTVIVLTGGLVRLTGSGLGCPTWPRCTDESFAPRHDALNVHGVIEFGNRLLTYVLIAVVIATLVAVWRWAGTTPELRRLAVLLVLGVPFQAVIGGITVLTDLNPWVVSLHLILSMLLIAASMVLIVRVRGDDRGWSRRPLVLLAYLAAWVTVYLGTVVTGSGPHAGDDGAHRNDLDPQVMSHVHAISVYVLVGLTLLVIWREAGRVRAAAVVLLVVELAQGLIGFIQYFTDLPILLVAAHLVGAGVLVAAATRLLLTTDAAQPTAEPAPDRASRV